MLNKTRLETNNTNLQSLIKKANALPDAGGGGGSGGGSVETCSININITSPMVTQVVYHVACFENGKIEHKNKLTTGATIIENVACNTIMYIIFDGNGTYNNPNGLTKIADPSYNMRIYQITASSGETVMVEISL